MSHYIARWDKYNRVFVPVDKPPYEDGAIVLVTSIYSRVNGDGLDKRTT